MEFDLKKVKDLMAAMDKAGASKVRIKVGEEEIEIDRSAPGAPVVHHHQPAPPPLPVAAAPAAAPAPAAAESGTFIKAPMVGTFYDSPSPDADPFVKEGDTVSEDTVVCIVEAMKVMNEVKAGVKGVIKEIAVESGHPVEFGTKLFRVG